MSSVFKDQTWTDCNFNSISLFLINLYYICWLSYFARSYWSNRCPKVTRYWLSYTTISLMASILLCCFVSIQISLTSLVLLSLVCCNLINEWINVFHQSSELAMRWCNVVLKRYLFVCLFIYVFLCFFLSLLLIKLMTDYYLVYIVFSLAGYVRAAMIPKGATNIQVSEVKPCSSFLGTNSKIS